MESHSPIFYPDKLTHHIFLNARIPGYLFVRASATRESAKMSILNYFHPVKQKQDLPDPSGPLSELIPSTAIASTNVKVLAALEDGEEMKKKVSLGPYLSLTPTVPRSMKSVNERQNMVLLLQYDSTKNILIYC